MCRCPPHGRAAIFWMTSPPTTPRWSNGSIKGADMVENMVASKAMLAAPPVEKADAFSMSEAALAREMAVAKIRDIVSDTYPLDTAIISTGSAYTPPITALNPYAAGHHITAIEDGRWHVESLVPKYAQATEDDPITIGLRFGAETGTRQAEQLELRNAWGCRSATCPPTCDSKADRSGPRTGSPAPSASSMPPPHRPMRTNELPTSCTAMPPAVIASGSASPNEPEALSAAAIGSWPSAGADCSASLPKSQRHEGTCGSGVGPSSLYVAGWRIVPTTDRGSHLAPGQKPQPVSRKTLSTQE